MFVKVTEIVTTIRLLRRTFFDISESDRDYCESDRDCNNNTVAKEDVC